MLFYAALSQKIHTELKKKENKHLLDKQMWKPSPVYFVLDQAENLEKKSRNM